MKRFLLCSKFAINCIHDAIVWMEKYSQVETKRIPLFMIQDLDSICPQICLALVYTFWYQLNKKLETRLQCEPLLLAHPSLAQLAILFILYVEKR
jgi:hypothetical protein